KVERHAKAVRGEIAEAGFLVGRKALAGEGWVEIKPWEQLAASDAGGGAGLVHAGDSGFEILVGVEALGFEVIEDFVVEDSPPRAFRDLVQRLAFFPVA